MVHLCPGIAHDLDVFREEPVAVLSTDKQESGGLDPSMYAPGQTMLGTIEVVSANGARYFANGALLHTVFFFARSPDAPRTIITVLSLSSMELR